MSEVADYIAGQGLQVRLPPPSRHRRREPGGPGRLHRRDSPSVGFTLDTGHAALGGIEPVDVIERHPGRIAHVHCKDVRGAGPRRSARARARASSTACSPACSPCRATASIDFGAVMKALKRIGYCGWIIVEAEQDPAHRQSAHVRRTRPGDAEARSGRGRADLRSARCLTYASARSRETTSGAVLEVTPQSAGWTYVGFKVLKLEPGESARGGEAGREACLVVLSGPLRCRGRRAALREHRRAA